MRHAREANKTANTLLLNVIVKVYARHSITYLNPKGLFYETFTFIKIHAVNLQVTQREQMRGWNLQFKQHRECDCDRIPKIKKCAYRKISLHSSDTLSFSVVTHADKLLKIPPLHINYTQISATMPKTDQASRCSSELWFWFLLLPAAQHGWSVSPCTLDTSTLGGQQICNRWRREASCQFLATDTWHRLILHVRTVEGLMFKCQRRIYGCLASTICHTLSCRPMHLRKNEFVGIRAFVNLVYMSSMCVCKIPFYKMH